MKKFLIFLGALFIMQTFFLLAGEEDIIWMKATHYNYHVEFSPNSYLILSNGFHQGNDNRRGIIIFNTEGDTVKQIYNSDGLEFISSQGIWNAHFSQDGRYLVTIWEYDKDHLAHGMLEIYETNNWTAIKRIEIPGDVFSLLGCRVLISPDNNTIVGITLDGIYFYDVQSGELIKHIWDYGQDMTKNVAIANAVYSKDGSHIYFTSTAKLPSSESKLRFLNTQTFEVDYTYNAEAYSLAISSDGRMIAFPSYLSGIAVEVMDIETKEIIQSIPGFVTGVSGIAFSKDNQFLAVTSSTISNLKIWNIQTGKDTLFSTGSFSSIDFSSDGQYFVSNLGRYLYLFKNNITSVNDLQNRDDNVLYPNPANNTVSIRFNLNMPGFTNVVIYDNTGREVKKVFQGHLEHCEQNIKADIRDLKSGNYFIRVNSIGTDITFKLIINK